jgi:hypothetical protein
VIRLFKKLALPLCALSLTLFSCSSEEEPEPTNVSVSFLRVGTKYTAYVNDGFFMDDTIKTVVDAQIGADTFLVRNYSETIAVAPTQYWVLRDNIFYTSYRLRDPETYQIECKFGEPVGTSWKVVKNGVQYTYTIEALNAPITTGDGVVNDAIKIKVQSAGAAANYQYISPTVGMLGHGSMNDESAVMKMVHYTVGTQSLTDIHLPPISYGSFPFLAVGKYWKYTESDWFGERLVQLNIESKAPDKNVFKIKLNYDGDVSYHYWYEDRGLLMVYEEDERIEQADPIYEHAAKTEIGHGWAGTTPSGTAFIYRVKALDEMVDTYYGELRCIAIDVANGMFSTQTNYWTQSKGNVLVTGMASRELIQSNVRKSEIPLIPVLSF